MLLCGKYSLEIVNSKDLDNPIEYFEKLTSFFIFSEGLDDFWSIVKYLLSGK